jgi:hypothetical protein
MHLHYFPFLHLDRHRKPGLHKACDCKNPAYLVEVERQFVDDAIAILISKMDDKAKLVILNNSVGKVIRLNPYLVTASDSVK